MRTISAKAQAVIDQKDQMFLDGVDCESGEGAYDQVIHVGDVIAPMNSTQYFYVTRLARYTGGVYWEGVNIDSGQRSCGPVSDVIIETEESMMD